LSWKKWWTRGTVTRGALASLELDKVLAELEAATVVAVALILALVLGAGAHDGWLEGGKVRGRRHWWEVGSQ